MFKVVQPWNHDETELQEIQQRAAIERKIEREVRRQMGQTVDPDPVKFIEALLNFPKSDIDDSISERHETTEEPDTSR
ncbi:hypothetical protein BTHE68_00900 [Burkholderia sp. THE68]|uniref:hypothetical protein n=1 Tax=Burkholderia sp. THE68 TaxID=758782 RepID=UPI001317D10D|nr:hypothetical protein [Burkholderia sp. THE68]BBU26356.1 hypothetical protein BTHE68_00900 [Burkholderia sp. THE68]